MERIEARRRIEAASAVLASRGWTDRNISNLIDGLQREDAVEEIERHAEVTDRLVFALTDDADSNKLTDRLERAEAALLLIAGMSDQPIAARVAANAVRS